MAALTIHQKRRRQDARDQNVLSQFGARSYGIRCVGLDRNASRGRGRCGSAHDGEETPIAGHALEPVRAAVFELES